MLKDSPSGVIDPVRRLEWPAGQGATPDDLLDREWLVTNGLGGYASGTLGGVPTRRYHGLLVAALPAPLGRTLVLNHVVETLRLDGGAPLGGGLTAAGPLVPLTGLEPHPGPLALPEALVEVRFENGRPVWRFEHDGVVLERSVLVPHRQNTTQVTYRLLASPAPL